MPVYVDMPIYTEYSIVSGSPDITPVFIPSAHVTSGDLYVTHFCIGDLVSINLKTGEIEYGPTYTPDAAAKQFWDAISRNVPMK